jgi:hypothetical protein
MRVWVFVLLGLTSLGMAMSVRQAAALLKTEEINNPSYDCRLTLRAPKHATDKAVVLTLDADGKGAGTRISIAPAGITVATIDTAKHATPCGVMPLTIAPGAEVAITVLRRDDWLGLLCGDRFARFATPRRGSATDLRLDGGWSIETVQVQRIEPVVFADDFMRTADDQHGEWTLQSGEWSLRSAWDADSHGNAHRFTNATFAQKAFSWAGAATTGAALCTAGRPEWDDYTVSVSLQPTAMGAAGFLLNMPDARSGLLVRWTPANDPSPTGNRLALYRYHDGAETLLASSPGGYVPGQWYRLTAVSDFATVRVAVDGRERLAVTDAPFRRGGIGLYCEGSAPTVFADVAADGRLLNNDLLRELRQSQVAERFRNNYFMQQWVDPRDEWRNYPGQPPQFIPPAYRNGPYYFLGHFVRREELYGDYWLTLTGTPSSAAPGALWLTLHSDGKDKTTGYRAVIQRAAGQADFTCELFRDTRLLARKTPLTLKTGEDYTFRLRHRGDQVWLEMDGAELLRATDAGPQLSGLRPAFANLGCFLKVRELKTTGENTLEYTFADAPTDWVGIGTWMPTVRWACDPKWSFLGGWSRGDAVLWHKQQFTGDHALLAYVGIKMEYPRERQEYDQRFRDLGVTICGDGRDPRSGYAVLYGAARDGVEDQRTVLYRNGVEVASAPARAQTFQEGAHLKWYALCLRKQGNTVIFTADNRPVITYTDPQPLDGGMPAVWTSDNGLIVSRVRIDFRTPPQPRERDTVVLASPWYPEWADVGRPLALDMPDPWSTSGKPVRLDIDARQGPPADLVLNGTRATFTPHAPGSYWYQITATDGEAVSPPVHLSLPVFAPALGRDDSHALALYRFAEGQGNVVHDSSAVAPPLPLAIPADAGAEWLPGRGLRLRGQGAVRSDDPATKLLAIAKSKAGTIEAWVSTDTLCPPDAWLGCLLTYEAAAGQQNLALLHGFYSGHTYLSGLVVAPRLTNLENANAPQPLRLQGFQVGLRHYVVTWDGSKVLAYCNGTRLGPAITRTNTGDANPFAFLNPSADSTTQDWNPAAWDPAARLLLGAQSNGRHAFTGAYYLLAIHDTCLTDAQIQRHYQAGPDG